MIPRTTEEWAAIEPNETDEKFAAVAIYDDRRWTQIERVAAGLRSALIERVAAASRLHEYERCVERVAKLFESQGGPYRGDPVAEARRILEVK